MLPPDDVPELLSLIACDLYATLGRLSPDMSPGKREQLAIDLMHACRTTIGGHPLPAGRHASASELRTDPAYSRLYDAWHALVADRCAMPDGWTDVATLNLIDALRNTAKGAYIPKNPVAATRHNVQEMWRRHLGGATFRALGLEYDLSSERVRQILKPLIDADASHRQPGLFDSKESHNEQTGH